MWLNRSSAQTPSSTLPPARDRPFSPSPRRSIHLTPNPAPQRPGLPLRASSLSLLSNTSTETLPGSKRAPNGSSLKHELSASPVANVSNPLEVLEGILGTSLEKYGDGISEERGRTKKGAAPDRVQDIDFGGLSLKEFAGQGRPARPSRPRTSTEAYVDSAHTIAGFEKERGNFEELHRSILACDDVLKSVETYLMSFQKDLGTVSAEIETLQSRSTTLNTKMENREWVEKILGPAVGDIVLSPDIVKRITEGPIDETWIKALDDVEKRSRAIDSKTKDGNQVQAAEDLQPLLENLTNKAVERIRDYVVAQIKALRSPNMNAQLIQQQGLLKHKAIYPFLFRHQPQLAEDISQAYVNTMRWYYLNNFTRYKTSLDKLRIHAISAQEVIGNDDSSKKSNLIANNRIPSAPHDAFSLGRRMELLQSRTHATLPSHIAEDDQSTHFLEVSFHSFNLALIDNASAEFSFLTEFFAAQNFHTISRKFAAIFSPTFELGQTLTKQLISDPNTDALGVLICVRLNQAFAFELQRRKVPAVEGYINGTNMLLWPRFQKIMDMHCESIRRATSTLSSRSASTALALASNNTAGGASTAPHPLTQKFANFVHAILALSSEAGDDEPVSSSLGRLRTDFEAFLVKMSKSVADARKRERFLGNNYSLVLTIIGDTTGKFADEVRGYFEEMKDMYSESR